MGHGKREALRRSLHGRGEQRRDVQAAASCSGRDVVEQTIASLQRVQAWGGDPRLGMKRIGTAGGEEPAGGREEEPTAREANSRHGALPGGYHLATASLCPDQSWPARRSLVARVAMSIIYPDAGRPRRSPRR